MTSSLIKRRTLLKTIAVAAVGPVAVACQVRRTLAAEASGKKLINQDFYTDGKFDVEKGKDGVLAMCRRFGYPVFPGMREKLWVSDYGAGKFTQLGLAAYLFENHYDAGGSYMLLDIFLLPAQMLPEHWHQEGDHAITKNEGWLVRWGKSYVVGIGEDNLASFPQIKIPDFHCGGTTSSKHIVEATPGMFVPLAAVGTKHWQYAGPEGAIITEVANFHTNGAVRHTDKALNDYFLQG